jgi:hypothetical protein
LQIREWDPKSLDYWEWNHGDYWPLFEKDASGAASLIGYAIICPKVKAENGGVHRHHFLFKDHGTVASWKFTKSTGELVRSPYLPCITTVRQKIHYFRVVGGEIEELDGGNNQADGDSLLQTVQKEQAV